MFRPAGRKVRRKLRVDTRASGSAGDEALWPGLVPRARSHDRQALALVGDVSRKVINQNTEQRQSGNAVCGQNPEATAFTIPGQRLGIHGCGGRIAKRLMLHADLQGQTAGDAKASRFTPLPKGRFDAAHDTTNPGLRKHKIRPNSVKSTGSGTNKRIVISVADGAFAPG